MRVISYSLGDYLSLTNDALHGYRGQETVCLTAEMKDAGARLLTFVAPTDFCWGMDISAGRTWSAWLEHFTTRSDLTPAIRHDLKSCGIKGQDVCLGLLPFPPDGEGELLAYGSSAVELSVWWFRSHAVPSSANLHDVTSLWSDHEAQLGAFFLLPYPDDKVLHEGVGGCDLRAWKSSLLCRLFWDPRGVGPSVIEEQIALLSQFQEHATAHQVNALLTPDFLLQEYVRWSISLLPPASALGKMVREVREESVQYLDGQLLDSRTRLAVLRVRLARLLSWPLDARLLAKQVLPYEQSQHPLVQETIAYVNDARHRYPVLFS